MLVTDCPPRLSGLHGTRLKIQLNSDLNLPGAGRSVILPNLRRGITEVHVSDVIVRLRKLNSIEQIVEFEA
jgi:hypothetical protein